MTRIKNRVRYDYIDLVRGYAIVLMFIYHFCFGLAQIELIDARFSSDHFWISFRTIIIFLFLTLVGIGLYLSRTSTTFSFRYAKRMLLLALYAGLISLISYIVRPNYYVYFGILHLIFIASILGLLFLPLYRLNLLLGLVCLFVGVFYENSGFNQSYLHWVGLGNNKVMSDDFAPLFPWFGFVLIGIFIAKQLFQQDQQSTIHENYLDKWKPQSLITKTLCWAGRQSLHLYFAHFISFYVIVYLYSQII